MKTKDKPLLDTEAVKLNYYRMKQEEERDPTSASVFEARMNRALDEYNDRIAALGSKATAEAISHLDFKDLSDETQQIIAEYED